jgi:hypothetical protein
VNIAARLESSAEKGSVLVSDTTYKLIKDFVEIENTSSIVVKGKAEELLVSPSLQLKTYFQSQQSLLLIYKLCH